MRQNLPPVDFENMGAYFFNAAGEMVAYPSPKEVQKLQDDLNYYKHLVSQLQGQIHIKELRIQELEKRKTTPPHQETQRPVSSTPDMHNIPGTSAHD